MKSNLLKATLAAAVGLMLPVSAHAIAITADNNAANLAGAIIGSGVTITGQSLSGHTSGSAVSSGTFTNASGTYGIGDGIVLSSGDVNHYNDGPNLSDSNTTAFGVPATAVQEALLDPITGGGLNHNDVTQLDITFDVGDAEIVFFNVVFGSEEFDVFVGSSFIDAFGIYLNGVNIALFEGLPVNIDHPDMAFIGGTELNGILDPTGGTGAPVMLFSGDVTPNSTNNLLTFIIADSGDSSLDSTVFISGFGTSNPGGGTAGGGTGQNGGISVPEPASMALLGIGLIGLAVARRRRRVT